MMGACTDEMVIRASLSYCIVSAAMRKIELKEKAILMGCILSLMSCISPKDIEDFTYWQIMYQEDLSFHINPPAHLQAGNDMCISFSSFYFPCVHE